MIFQWGPNPAIANSSQCYGLISSKLQNYSHYSPLEWYFNGVQTQTLLILHIAMALSVQNGKIPATIAPWNDISMGSKLWHCQFFTLQWPYEFKMAKFWSLYPPGMILQWGPNSGIANSSHSFSLMSSKLQNSGHHSPLGWYFNGVQTLALPILHIDMALWVQNCKIPATIAPWNDI